MSLMSPSHVSVVDSLSLPEGLSAIPTFEVVAASFFVAALCGVTAAVAAARLSLPRWVATLGGFGVAWLVCEFMFPVNHHLATVNFFVHRAYDAVSLATAYLMSRELDRAK
jgi:ribose/xylose/arabinose/galactoside ABC-type transport system permease subunit